MKRRSSTDHDSLRKSEINKSYLRIIELRGKTRELIMSWENYVRLLTDRTTESSHFVHRFYKIMHAPH